MYRAHAGPPPPDPYEPARQNARSCGYIQLGTVGMNTLTLVLLAVQQGPTLFPHLSGDTKAMVLFGAIAYVLFAGAWAAINAFGLFRRSKLAHWSSVGFAIFTIVTCVGFAFGLGLLFLLFKPEMKGYYDARPSGLEPPTAGVG